MENVMSMPLSVALPGARIGGYRNSLPRRIRLMGLGAEGSRIARSVAGRGWRNVEVVTRARPVGWDEIAPQPESERINMVVLVCGEGDERLFDPVAGKPGMLVTFVVVTEGGVPSMPDGPRAARMRGLADLFVTTSDSDYVGDLIENLAS